MSHIRRVLLPIDLSSSASTLASTVQRMIECWSVDITLLHVLESRPLFGRGNEMERAMAQLEFTAATDFGAARVTRRVDRGGAADRILDYVRENDVEGRSVTDGFAYRGQIASLRGKFVFGDIANGRLFAADLAEMKKADDGVPQTVAPIEEIQLYVKDASGKRVNVSLQELIDKSMGASISRADLHISRTRDGELLITSRQDGMIRMLVN